MSIFEVGGKSAELEKKTLEVLKPRFEKIDETTRKNQRRLLEAYINNKVSAVHLGISTGYGYDDAGRDTIEKVFAEYAGAEDSLFRHNFMSGTHTLAVMLFGVLRPKDKMLILTGRPYDTLIDVLGLDKAVDGSLSDLGVEFEIVELDNNGMPDKKSIEEKLKGGNYRVAYIQRSRGYSLRHSLTAYEVGELCGLVKSVSPDTVTMVDNCYGEFVNDVEPTALGADIMAGSLIKNAGGGIASTGGYIAGKHVLVEKCAARLTAPGVGREIGATLGHNRELYMGLFAAPHTTGEAIKTALYASSFFSSLGYDVTPAPNEERGDIVQVIKLGTPEKLIAFCKGIQSGSPVDSFVSPEPSSMPGYDSEVIMAAGAFTLGSSIELSADAPLREPYAVYMQGGLNFDSAEAGIMLAAKSLEEKNLL